MKLFLETDPILKWEIVKLGIAESTVSFFSFSRNYTIWFSPPPTPSLHISASPSEWQATPASLMRKSGIFSTPSSSHPSSPQPHPVGSFLFCLLNTSFLHPYRPFPGSHHSPTFCKSSQISLSAFRLPPTPLISSPVCSQGNLLKFMPLLKPLPFPLPSGPGLDL